MPYANTDTDNNDGRDKYRQRLTQVLGSEIEAVAGHEHREREAHDAHAP